MGASVKGHGPFRNAHEALGPFGRGGGEGVGGSEGREEEDMQEMRGGRCGFGGRRIAFWGNV